MNRTENSQFRMKKWEYFTLLTIGAGFIFLYYDFTVDDSFIFYRYSKNLLEHGFWNYNPLQIPKEEAYTSFLATLLAGIPITLGTSPKWFFTILNLIAIVWAFRNSSGTLKENFSWALWLCLGNALLYIHFFSGMETFLFMSVLFILGRIIIQKERSHFLLFLCFILPLIRPDGLFFSILGLYHYTKAGKKGILPALLALSLLVFYWWGRASFFGSFLPNPIDLKSFQEFKFTIFLYNLYQAKIYLLFLILLLIYSRNQPVRALVATSFITILVFYAPSNLMMNYADRFFFQISFPILLLGLLHLPFKKQVIISSIILFNLYALIPFRYNPILTYGKRLQDSYIHLGNSLEPFSGKNTWMVCGEAGSIPYFSGWNNLDPIGLGTRLDKSKNLTESLDPLNPSLIFFYENKEGVLEIKPGTPRSERLLAWLKKNEYYRASACWFSPDYRIIAFLRRGVENESEILRALKENENYSLESITSLQRRAYSLFGY
jgi:hypothetical protein